MSVHKILDTHQEEPPELLDDNCTTPDSTTPYQDHVQTNWPDALTIQIPGVSSTISESPPEVTYTGCQTKHTRENQEIS